jgi:hypothetical protein
MVILRHGDLLAPGRYLRHSRFVRVANYQSDEQVLSLVIATAEVGAGPLALVLAERALPDVETVTVTADGVVFLDDEKHELCAAQRYDSHIELPAPGARGSLSANLALAAAFVRERGHPQSWAFLLAPGVGRQPRVASAFQRALAARIELRVAELFEVPGLAGLCAVRGLGVGLTPSGDDFLCGYLHARHLSSLLGIRRFDRAELPATLLAGGDVLTRSFLRCAVAGAVSEPVQALLAVLCARPAAPELHAALERVLRLGETSGADWATGLLLTLLRMVKGLDRRCMSKEWSGRASTTTRSP